MNRLYTNLDPVLQNAIEQLFVSAWLWDPAKNINCSQLAGFKNGDYQLKNDGVQIEVYYADMPTGYTITKSSTLNYSGTGWGGWSAPAGQFVTGGGYQFATSGAYPQVSQIALENSSWPHYNYGPNEQGWVVQSGAVGGPAELYVISSNVPEPTTMCLLGLGGLLLRRRKKA